LLNQIKADSDVNELDGIHSLSEDELRDQNSKLRQAITTLTNNYEGEKDKLESKIKEIQLRADQADDYEKKLEDMDLLIEELDNKEQERLEME